MFGVKRYSCSHLPWKLLHLFFVPSSQGRSNSHYRNPIGMINNPKIRRKTKIMNSDSVAPDFFVLLSWTPSVTVCGSCDVAYARRVHVKFQTFTWLVIVVVASHPWAGARFDRVWQESSPFFLELTAHWVDVIDLTPIFCQVDGYWDRRFQRTKH